MSPSDPKRGNGVTRPYDLVLFGATGFTGALVAEYLAGHAPPSLRWALAGRSREKLEAVRRSLGMAQPRLAELPLLVADSHDRASLDRVAQDAHVVCTTVGPYALHGAELVAACVDAGTHYCDLTGEVQFIRRMIDAHHERAQQTGARIVHCAGFDSIPSDLGCLMLQEHAIEAFGAPCSVVRFSLTKNRGGVSGGTVASMLNLLDEARRDRSVLRTVGHPYALNPPGEQTGPDGSDQRGIGWDADAGTITAPFVMAAINTRVVRRSNALFGYRYGRDFSYSEVTSLPASPKGALTAAGLTLGLGGLLLAANVPPLRRALEKRLPKPGEGPSRRARERGFFEVELRGTGARPSGEPFEVRAVVAGTQDPGYGETAKMLGESALCLASDALTSAGGVLTPAVALGMTLVGRLRTAGMTFDIR
ncbi:MAG: saccharopine dehydrogenase NADP-binding domain-containing protein [Polyangiaceae bacterium]|nr:saccharopine dehydrogenase NADP-binding domain-containing protein [Polyangiaceae bacterium]